MPYIGTEPAPQALATGDLGDDIVTEGKIGSALHTIWIPANAMRPTASNGCESIADVEKTSG